MLFVEAGCDGAAVDPKSSYPLTTGASALLTKPEHGTAGQGEKWMARECPFARPSFVFDGTTLIERSTR